jgi:hypothetical protein
MFDLKARIFMRRKYWDELVSQQHCRCLFFSNCSSVFIRRLAIFKGVDLGDEGGDFVARPQNSPSNDN